jgi:hypothetical protein
VLGYSALRGRVFNVLLTLEVDKGVLLRFGDLRPFDLREGIVNLHFHLNACVFGEDSWSVWAMIARGDTTAETGLMYVTATDWCAGWLMDFCAMDMALCGGGVCLFLVLKFGRAFKHVEEAISNSSWLGTVHVMHGDTSCMYVSNCSIHAGIGL